VETEEAVETEPTEVEEEETEPAEVEEEEAACKSYIACLVCKKPRLRRLFYSCTSFRYRYPERSRTDLRTQSISPYSHPGTRL
tara:strand:- start:498 stop:746 length:249 start_codon:yes stop_codon:yes gene_type:complete